MKHGISILDNKEHLQNWILVLFYIKDLMNTFAGTG